MYFKNLLKVCGFILMCFFVIPAMAQNKTITGKVTDAKDGSPIIGASVVSIPAGSGGTVTDINGDYKITVTTTATSLSFTYIGYNKQTIAINGKSVVNAALEANTSNLNEVVVVGYGTQKVKDATGSVASLSTKDFNKGVISTPDQLLQGRISGVTVSAASGEPGSSATINIRGTASIQAGTGPLYVVDGVPLDGGQTASGALNGQLGSSTARNPLEFLNPNDIENISVLKDASAAAIYGARGANGVVLITTKKGTKGQGIQFTSNTSISTVAKTYDLLNASQFVTAVSSALQNLNPASAAYQPLNNASTDWQSQILRTGVSQSNTLGFGGAADGFTYRASGSFDNQNGIVKNSGLQRITGRLNASQSLFGDRLKLDLQFLASNVQNTYAPIADNSGFQGSLIGAALILNPTYPITNADGSYYFDGTNLNPVQMLNYIDDSDNINRFLTNFSATLKIVKNLSYKATFGDDNSSGKRSTWYDPRLSGFTSGSTLRNFSIDQISGNGLGQVQNIDASSIITEHTLTYDAKFKDNSSLNILAGYSYQQTTNNQYGQIGFDTQTKNVLVKDINNFSKHTWIFGDTSGYKIQSFFGRINYSIQDKYLITGTLRRDGSSRFGPNNQYGNFPAVAAKWKIINESFAPKSVFDDLSLRLNWGQTGNQDFPSYAFQQTAQIQYGGGTQINSSANPNLKWETDTQYGAGIDFSVLSGRLTGTIDVYNKSTTNTLLLQSYPQPAASPYTWVNLPGSVVNKGVEVSLNFEAVKSKEFRWNIAYNMQFLNNKVENFGTHVVNTGAVSGQGLSGAYGQVIENNYPLFTYKLPVFQGFDSQGYGIYAGKGIDDSKLLGSPLPTFTAGLSNSFSYGRFNLSFFINAETGFYVYNNTANAYFYRGTLLSAHNTLVSVGNSSENVLNSGQLSTRFLEKGDFARLSNATFGYDFNLNGSKVIKTLRAGLSGQNLLLITGYSGLDPEVNVNKAINGISSRGFDYAGYPKARTFSFSVNAGF
jgi:iron complex outermembrane receptor protein